MKSARKLIGQRIRKYGSHFTKYLYERDTIFSTGWVFAFILVLGLVPINFSVLNPIKLALKDFDFNDMTYAKLGKSEHPRLDSNIVIINIGHADREALAMIIDKTASFQPRVMGLDVLFDNAGDAYQDSILRESILKHKNLVSAVRIDWNEKEDNYYLSRNHFLASAARVGYVNFDNEEFETTRNFSPFRTDRENTYYSFAAALVANFDSSAYHRLRKRNKELETIHYSRRTNWYMTIEVENLMLGRVDSSAIKGKIALLGYVNSNPYDVEDKKFTPMNNKFVGKTVPDMSGTVVHANIISMVLEKNYIKKLPSWVNWLVATLICWLHMSFFIRYYLEDHIWFHLVAKIAQLISAIFFAYLGILLFSWYDIKLDMKYSLIVIIMAVDVIYFYEAFAVWMHKKFHYQTVFHQKHH